MEKTLLMAVDLGTSFIKSVVYDTDGAMLAMSTQPVKDERPAAGMFIQRGEDLFASVVACMTLTEGMRSPGWMAKSRTPGCAAGGCPVAAPKRGERRPVPGGAGPARGAPSQRAGGRCQCGEA